MHAVPAARPPRRRENRTRYVVLGMLTQGPMNGYALRKAIAGSVGHFWQESFGQLYPTLRALTSEGWVRLQRSPPVGRRERGSTFAITPRGAEALTAWVAKPPLVEPTRSEVLLKVFFGGIVPREALLGNLRGLAAQVRMHLDQLEALAWELDAIPEERRGGPYPRLTLDFGVRFMGLALEWLADVERAAARAHRPPSGPGAPPGPAPCSPPSTATTATARRPACPPCAPPAPAAAPTTTATPRRPAAAGRAAGTRKR